MSSADGGRAVHLRGQSADAQAFAFDELDRRIIACLRADGRASWTEIARRCGSSVATASRRGQRLLAGSTVRVAVVPTTTHPGRTAVLFLRMACRSGCQAGVAAALSKHPDIRLLSLVSGPYDILAEVFVDTGRSLFGQLAEIEEVEGVEWCETDLVLHEYKVDHDWTWQLLVGETAASPVLERHVCDASHMDDIDWRIVDVMREDGRAGFSVVAGQVGLDETTVRRRFEAMLSRGCVMVVTLAPASALGFTSEVMLEISVEPSKLGSVSEQLTSFAGVRYVAATLSGSSLWCEMIQPSEAALFSFLTETLATLDGVRGWQASMELLTVRRGFVETPWWHRELEEHLGSLADSGPGNSSRRRDRGDGLPSRSLSARGRTVRGACGPG
jgi:DNA-binding Lrp family transcriptional regulator